MTTFQSEGVVPKLVIAESEEELKSFLKTGDPFYVLGKGSNTVLNPDSKYGTFLKVGPGIVSPEVQGSTLRVGAGVPVSKLIQVCQEAGLTGLEFSAGVPASVGGMIAMNFGCFGFSISDYVRSVRIWTRSGKSLWLDTTDLAFGYRSSIFQQQDWIIVEAIFQLGFEDKQVIKDRSLKWIQTRLDKQPLRARTFGSTFKNPQGLFAGEILEKLGYKGKEIGHIKLSEKHANFMVNMGGATFEEVVQLTDRIKQEALAQLGIAIELEVKLI